MPYHDASCDIGSTGRLIASVSASASERALLRTRLGFPDEIVAVICEPPLQASPAAGSVGLARRFDATRPRSIRLAVRALSVRHDRILPPNAPPESVGDRAHRWTYAVFVAAMLRPEHGARPDPWAGLFDAVVPAVGRRWLAEDTAVSTALAEVLAGRARSDNPIEGILSEATFGSSSHAGDEVSAKGETDVGAGCSVGATRGPVLGPAAEFFSWLRDGASAGSIETNTDSAFLHRVPEGVLLVWPDAFRAFLIAQGGEAVSGRATRRLRQSVFEMGWHLRVAGGIVVHEYVWRVGGAAGDTVSGVVIVEAGRVLDSVVPLNLSLARIEGMADSAP
jgi:hypothetical protein